MNNTASAAIAALPASTDDGLTIFDLAAHTYRRSPSPVTLFQLTRAAVGIMPAANAQSNFATALVPLPAAPRSDAWRSVCDFASFDKPFTEIRIVLDDLLSEDEIEQVTGAVGYALTETVKGDALAAPTLHFPTGDGLAFTVLDYRWDSENCIRTEPDFDRAFEVVSVYIFHGTRVRTTERAGPGTRGTQLWTGIGEGRCNATFYVR